MWLLNTFSLQLRAFTGRQRPDYVILSHVWTEEEVSFDDIRNGTASSRTGFRKLQGSCDQALRDGYEWIWIDTCCINKSSSSELQESINSMYKWYQRANICYVYLFDVPDREAGFDETFAKSKWFTRGWTLQELLAPELVEFYAADWAPIGTKRDRGALVSAITGIQTDILLGTYDLYQTNVAERMSWAAHRNVTRDEDIAYCLLGIFDINLPMLYGEGGFKAFMRLQEELCHRHPDHTILLWTYTNESPTYYCNLLASRPAYFCRVENCAVCPRDRPECFPRSIPYRDLGAYVGEGFDMTLTTRLLGTQISLVIALKADLYDLAFGGLVFPNFRASHFAVLGPWENIGIVCIPLVEYLPKKEYGRLNTPAISLKKFIQGSISLPAVALSVTILAQGFSWSSDPPLEHYLEIEPSQFVVQDWYGGTENRTAADIDCQTTATGSLRLDFRSFPGYPSAICLWFMETAETGPLDRDPHTFALLMDLRVGYKQELRPFPRILMTPLPQMLNFLSSEDPPLLTGRPNNDTMEVGKGERINASVRPRPSTKGDPSTPVCHWYLKLSTEREGKFTQPSVVVSDPKRFWPTHRTRNLPRYDIMLSKSFGIENLEI